MRSTFHDSDLQTLLDRDGYVTLPLLDRTEIERLRSSLDELGPAPGDPKLACQSSFHSYDSGYKGAASEAVLSVLRPQVDRHLDRQRLLPANFIVKWPGAMSGFGLHQDLSLVDERFHRSVEVWVALDDTDEQNGQLWMVPGSHRWLAGNIRGIQAFPFPFYGVARRVIDRHSVPVPLRAGEAIVFDHAILHFSLPNRSQFPRRVAICDAIPEEAANLHYFGDGDGNVGVYQIDDSFWAENNPFTLWKPPPRSQRIGVVNADYYRELSDEDLDRLLAEGLAIESEHRPKGAMNAAKPWCHRCGASDLDLPRPDRWVGNVTLLCEECKAAEARRAPTPEHVG